MAFKLSASAWFVVLALELIRDASGFEITAKPLISYIEKKYSSIYCLG